MQRCLAWAVALLILGQCVAQAEDWPQWRGPNHDNISAEKGLQLKWTEPPPCVWQQEIGAGFSGLSIVQGKVYTAGTVEGAQVLFCLDAKTGSVVWRTALEEEYVERQGGDGPRATPAVDGEHVYIQTARGKVACLNTADGKIAWTAGFDAVPQWGYSASPLIEGELVIVTGGGAHGMLVALDKKTGAIRWECGQGVVGYATPYPITLSGKRFIVGFMGKEVILADAATGKQAWSMPWETSYDVNAATPVFHNGLLLLSSGYKHGSILVKLTPDGDKVKSEKVWQNDNLRAKFQTPVLCEGYLYVSDEVGLKCVAFESGEVKWQDRGITSGTIILADGHLILLTEGGELQIAPASPKGFEPVTKVKVLDGRCWTVPTLSDGCLFVRNLKVAACYRLKP